MSGKDVDTLTTQQRVAIADGQKSLKMGKSVPILIEDFHFREEIFHFDHERSPERVVRALVYGAHGRLTPNDRLARIDDRHLDAVALLQGAGT